MEDLAWSTDIRLAMAGDKEAFARLIREIQMEMYRMTRSMLSRDEDCADAIQETILKAYVGIPKLREPAFFKTWLFRILIRECQQIIRRHKRTVPAERFPESTTDREEKDLDLRDAVERLEEPARTIVKLHYYADIPLAEISGMLDIPQGTLKSRLHRARRQLGLWLGIPEERGIGYELR